MNQRCSLEFKSDNMAALVMVANLRGRSPGLSLLAQEMALDFALSSYEPDAVTHTPGVMNVTADHLSRKHDPAKAPWQPPAALRSVTCCTVPARTWSWWRSITPR